MYLVFSSFLVEFVFIIKITKMAQREGYAVDNGKMKYGMSQSVSRGSKLSF